MDQDDWWIDLLWQAVVNISIIQDDERAKKTLIFETIHTKISPSPQLALLSLVFVYLSHQVCQPPPPQLLLDEVKIV